MFPGTWHPVRRRAVTGFVHHLFQGLVCDRSDRVRISELNNLFKKSTFSSVDDMPGSVLGHGDAVTSETGTALTLMELHSNRRQ